MTTSKLSILAASKRTGKSRTTIAKHMNSGRLSFDVTPDGKKQIDISELERVYGLSILATGTEEGSTKTSPTPRTKKSAMTNQSALFDLLEKEKEERRREREQLSKQIDYLQDALTQAQEGTNRITLLLDNQSATSSGWDKLNEVERRIANQFTEEKRVLKAASEKKVERYKKALEEERSKSIWKRLFR